MGLFFRKKRSLFRFRKKEKKKKVFHNKKGFEDVFIDQKTGLKTFGSYVDLTLLDPRATSKNIEELVRLANDNKYYSVVVPPVFVQEAKRLVQSVSYGAIKVSSVVSFPLGNATISAKVKEIRSLVKKGADEIEICLNLHYVKSANWYMVKREIQKVVRACKKRVVKLVIETCYLTVEEMERILKIAMKSRVDYIMTSTGYAPIGATVEVVERLSSLSNGQVGIKASGGIKTKLEAESFLRLGATRIGTSRII